MAGRGPQNTKKRRLPHETIPDGHVNKCRPGLVAANSLTLRRTRSSQRCNSGGGDDHRVRQTSPDNNTSADSSKQDDGEGEISSTSSTDDDEDEDEDDDDDDALSHDSASTEDMDQVPTLPITKKPRISTLGQVSDLRSRLASFLPQLQKANADLLESDPAALRRLDQVDDDEEHYIEMNLGLGVLKEKRAGAFRDGVRLEADSTTDEDSDEVRQNYETAATRMAPMDQMNRKPPSAKFSGIDEMNGT